MIDDLTLTKECLMGFSHFPEELQAFKVYFEHNLSATGTTYFTDDERSTFIAELAKFAPIRLSKNQNLLDEWFDYLIDKGFEMEIYKYFEDKQNKPKSKKNRKGKLHRRS